LLVLLNNIGDFTLL